MNNPKVSVLMNCYNGEEFLRDAIDSVIAQTYTNWEIIFWDNVSEDKSAEIVHSYNNEKIKYFRGEVNVPLYHARNLAIEKISGDIVAFLDVDDVWLPTKLEKQVPLFAKEKVGAVFSDTFFFKDDVITKQLYKSRPYYTGNCFRELLSDYFVSLETLLLRRSAFDELSYFFDERFQIIGDADIVRRIALNGWELDMVDEPLAKWRIHDSNLTFREPIRVFKENEQMLEEYRKIDKNFDKTYAGEIFNLRAGVAVMVSKYMIAADNLKEAREMLRPYLSKLKVSILYSLSFLPKMMRKILLKKLGVQA